MGNFSCLSVFPAAVFALSVVTFITSYSIAVWRQDVYPWWPTISDTATSPPESNIFGIMFNWSCFLAISTMYVRFLQLKHDADWNEEDRPIITKLNYIALVIGSLSCIGGSIVANFQETEEAIAHEVGALLVFVMGILYCWVQSGISYKMQQCGTHSYSLFISRMVVVSLMTCFFIISMICNTVSVHKRNKQTKLSNKNNTWKPDVKGFEEHVTANVSEWFLALCFIAFILTFTKEFNKMKIEVRVRRRPDLGLPFLVSTDAEGPSTIASGDHLLVM